MVLARRLASVLGRRDSLFAVSFLLVGVTMGISELIYNLYLVRVGFREDFIGLVVFMTMAGVALTAIPLGYLGRRVPHKLALVGGAAVLGLAVAGQSLVTSPVALLALGLLNGVGQSCYFVIIIPFLAAGSSLERRKQTFALNYGGYAAAVVVGFLLGGQLPGILGGLLASPSTDAVPYRLTLLLGATCSLLAALVLLPLPTVRPSGIPSHSAPEPTTIPFHRSPGTSILLIAFSVGIANFASGMSNPFFNVYLASRFEASTSAIGIIYMASTGLSVAAIFASPVIARWLGSVPAIGYSRLAVAPLVVAIALSPHLGLVALGMIGRAIVLNIAWTLDNAFITEIIPSELQARASSVRTLAVNLPWALASMLAGWLIVQVGYAPLFMGAAVVAALGGAVFLGYFRDPSPQQKPAPGQSPLG